MFIFKFFLFEEISSLSLKQINFCSTNYGLSKQNYQAAVFFKVMQYGYETFRNIKPAVQNHIAKII